MSNSSLAKNLIQSQLFLLEFLSEAHLLLRLASRREKWDPLWSPSTVALSSLNVAIVDHIRCATIPDPSAPLVSRLETNLEARRHLDQATTKHPFEQLNARFVDQLQRRSYDLQETSACLLGDGSLDSRQRTWLSVIQLLWEDLPTVLDSRDFRLLHHIAYHFHNVPSNVWKIRPISEQAWRDEILAASHSMDSIRPPRPEYGEALQTPY